MKRIQTWSKKPTFVLMLLLCCSIRCFSQSLHLPNEVVVFSFTTQNGKTLTLDRDTANKYLIYRYGTSKKIELQYPAQLENSWENFTYSFYLRGGGIQNEGMELNYIYFIKDGFQYTIYDNYYAIGNKRSIGIKIMDIKSQKTTDIKGKPNTRKGSLASFRDNELVKKSDELFD